MEHDVYICYSEFDSYLAGEICKKLEKEKFSCRYAERDLTQEDRDGKEPIRYDEISRSRVMVLVFTDYSNASAEIRGEIQQAISSGIPVIPFKLTKANPSGGMEYFLSTLHWLDASGKPLSKSLAELSDLVRKIIEGSEENEVTGSRIRRRRLNIVNILTLIGSAALFLFGCYGLYLFFLNPVFRCPTSVLSFFGGLAAILLGACFAVRSLFVFRIRWLTPTVLASSGVILLIMGTILMVILSNAPSGINITNQSKDRSMNMSNGTIVVYSFTDNTVEFPVYYADTVNGVPGIFKASIDDFKDGKDGVCLLSGVEADNLALSDNGNLFYRDVTDGGSRLCVFDLTSRTNRVLKTASTDRYYASHNWVMFDYALSAPYGIGVITSDGSCEKVYLHDTAERVCCADEDVFYIIPGKGLYKRSSDGSSTLVSKDVTGQYIFFDNYLYYTGSGGSGVYQSYIKDLTKADCLTPDTAAGMIAFKGYIYYLNADDENKLYRVSFKGGESEKLSDSSYAAINAVEEYLYLRKVDGPYERFQMDETP